MSLHTSAPGQILLRHPPRPPHHNRHLLRHTHTWTHKSLYLYTKNIHYSWDWILRSPNLDCFFFFKTPEALEASELNGGSGLVLLLWRWLPGIPFTLCFFPFVSPPSCFCGSWIIAAHSLEAPEVLTLTLLTICSLAPAPWWSSSQPLPDRSVTLAWLDTHVKSQLGRSPFTTVSQAHKLASAGTHHLLSVVWTPPTSATIISGDLHNKLLHLSLPAPGSLLCLATGPNNNWTFWPSVSHYHCVRGSIFLYWSLLHKASLDNKHNVKFVGYSTDRGSTFQRILNLDFGLNVHTICNNNCNFCFICQLWS